MMMRSCRWRGCRSPNADTFQEVKGKRGKKKVIKEVPVSRKWTNSPVQGYNRGSRDNMVPRPPVSGPGMASIWLSISNSSSQSSSGSRHGDWSRTAAHLLSQGKASKPVVRSDKVYAGQHLSLPSTKQSLKLSGSMVPRTDLNSSVISSSTDNKTSRPPVSGYGMTSVNSSQRQTIASSSASTDGPAVSLQSFSGFEHGGWPLIENPQLDENSTFAMRLAPKRDLSCISKYNGGELKNSSSYVPHVYSHDKAEGSASQKTAESYPAVIIPDHLQVTNTVCASICFGSFNYGETFTGLLSEETTTDIYLETAREESELTDMDAHEESELTDMDARNQSSAANLQAAEHPVSLANELRPNVPDSFGLQDMPSEGHAYPENSSETSTTEDPQGDDVDILEPDMVMEIVSRTNVETVVRLASLSKAIRHFITHPRFIRTINLGSSFGCSLYLGHILSFRGNMHLRPQFVSTPFGHKLLAKLEHNLDSVQFRDDLFDFAPFGSDGSFLVLREHVDPRLCVWNPLTRTLVFLPISRHGITRRSSCIMQVDGQAFSINLVRLRLNRRHLLTQSFTSLPDALNQKVASGMWSAVSVREVPGPAAKISMSTAFPVVLYGVCYWLCKCSGRYIVLKVEMDTLAAPEFINVPVECSLTAQFHRNNILLVPATGTRIGHIDRGAALYDDQGGRLGLVALDAKSCIVWTRSNAGYWERGAVIARERIMLSLNILPRKKPVQLELIWCAKASGVMLAKVAGYGSAVVNLNTLDAAFVSKTSVERNHPDTRIRNSCPLEFDFVSCLTSMQDY